MLNSVLNISPVSVKVNQVSQHDTGLIDAWAHELPVVKPQVSPAYAVLVGGMWARAPSQASGHVFISGRNRWR